MVLQERAYFCSPAARSDICLDLWGSRLFTRFLHDGRALSFYDSIQAHDGQGAAAKAKFSRLAPTDRNKVEAFLRSL